MLGSVVFSWEKGDCRWNSLLRGDVAFWRPGSVPCQGSPPCGPRALTLSRRGHHTGEAAEVRTSVCRAEMPALTLGGWRRPCVL